MQLIVDRLVDSWVKDGYLSKKHEDKFFENGKFYLEGFLKEGFDRNNLPEAMEYKFVFPLNSKIQNLKPVSVKPEVVDVIKELDSRGILNSIASRGDGDYH